MNRGLDSRNGKNRGTPPAVFIRVANTGVRAYGKWKCAQAIERKGALPRKPDLHVVRTEGTFLNLYDQRISPGLQLKAPRPRRRKS